MALLFNLYKLENVKGRHDRIIKLSYRGNSYVSRIIPNGEGDILVNESFEWPVARFMEPNDIICVELFNYNKFISNRLVGCYSMCCQELMQIGNISLRDYLTDGNNSLLKICIEFEVTYHSPDGSVGDWKALGFDFPLYSVEDLERLEQSVDRGSLWDDTYSVTHRKENGSSMISFDDDETDVVTHTPSSFMEHVNRQFVPTLDKAFPKAKHFQVAVTVYEARNLSGLDLDPAVVVSVGDQQRCTFIHKSTNCPFYNQLFVFNFEIPLEMFMDTVITIAVLNSNKVMDAQGLTKNLFQLGKTLGVYKIDVGYVWAEKGHQYVCKWAPLTDPTYFATGNRGFVRCTIVTMSSNSPIEPATYRSADNDDFEKNLMMPKEITFPRPPIRFIIKIYKARDIPRMDIGVLASIKKALTNEDMALADPCVRVTFGTETELTSVKRATYSPIWNQEIVFTDLSPPLYKRFKVQLVDHNPLRDDVIATHFIPLKQICSWSKKHGFLPTFGPCWVNMYGSNRSYTVYDKHNYLNEGFGEGVAYRGSILMSVSASTFMTSAGSFGGVCQPTQLISSMAAGPPADFLLYCSFLHATMIDAKLGGKPIQFEISIGNFGNQMDGVVHVDVPVLFGDSEDDDSEGEAKKSRKGKTEEPKNSYSTTYPMIPETEDQIYYHMPFNDTKPCVFVKAKFEDQRRRMYTVNMLNRIIDNMEMSLNVIEELLVRELDECSPRLLLKDLMMKVSSDCKAFVDVISEQQRHQSVGITPLDKERMSMYIRKVTAICKKLRKTRAELKEMKIKEMLEEAREVQKKLQKIAAEPQHALPDVFIWMICAGKRVASARVPSKDILYSAVEEERGKDCGKVQILLLKLAGKDVTRKKGWVLQAKLFVYLWLGLDKHRSTYTKGLPAGYFSSNALIKSKKNLKVDPPLQIVYSECHKFELRAHLYQARGLLGSDLNGLSDPYVRVFCSKASGRSHYLKATLCPTWNETVVLKKVVYHFSLDYIVEETPSVVLEVFDKDFVPVQGQEMVKAFYGTDEYMGRIMVKPEVLTLDNRNYTYPKLLWWPIWRSRSRAGEILAAFELIQLTNEGTVPQWIPILDPPVSISWKQYSVIRMPREITPKLDNLYRCEVMFWGVRDLSRLLFLEVQNPVIVFEFAGKTMKSSVIENTEKTINFKEPVRVMDVLLPQDPSFHPPITMLCNGTIAFGRKVLIGSCSIPNIRKHFDYRDDAIEDPPMFVFGDGIAEPPEHLEVAGLTSASALQPIQELPQGQSSASTTGQPNVGTTSQPSGDASGQPSGGTTSPLNAEATVQSIGGNTGQHGQQSSVVGSRRPSQLTRPPNMGNGDMKRDEKALDVMAKTVAAPNMPAGKSNKPNRKLVAALSQFDNEEVIDWWTRYYASCWEKMKKEKEEEAKQEKEEDTTWPSMRAPDIKSARKLAKLTWSSRKRVSIQNVSSNSEVANLNVEGDKTKDDGYGNAEIEDLREEQEYKKIKKFKIYDCELEDVPEFGGFLDRWDNFPIVRGKVGDEEEDEQTRVVGYMKGQIKIYKLPADGSEHKLKLKTFLPSNEPVEVIVRVYIIKAIGLHPCDIDSRADPFLVIKCGNKKENNEKNYVANHLNPVFGKVFTFDARLPHDHMLTVQIYDFDQFSTNDLIGETKIDIENRFYSKHRGGCGLKSAYDIFGCNQWHDGELPSMIVDKFCADYDLPQPDYDLANGMVTIFGHVFYGETEIVNEMGVVKLTKEHLALEILHHWDNIMPGFPLVPEHIERRSLYSPEHPGVEQGKVEMWVDIFNKELPPPGPPIGITPRKAVDYELRIIIWNAAEVVLNDVSFISDVRSSDIFVKGWLDQRLDEMQQTDVHYRSLTGDGYFNWRFIYRFSWLAAEKKMIIFKKDGVLQKDIEVVKVPAKLTLQVYDADLILSDDCLGMLTLILNRMPRGAKTANMCSLDLLKDDAPKCNLFKLKKMRGWWPFVARLKPDEIEEQKGEKKKKKKKRKKKKKKKGEEEAFEMEPEPILNIQGKVEMEFHLLPVEDADKAPVGKERAGPEPLPTPNRPDTSFSWFLNPWTILKKVIWPKLKWLIIKSFIAALFIALIVLFIYASPGYLVKKMLGA